MPQSRQDLPSLRLCTYWRLVLLRSLIACRLRSLLRWCQRALRWAVLSFWSIKPLSQKLRGKSRKDPLPLVVIHYSSNEVCVSHILSRHLGQALVGFGVSYGTSKDAPQSKHRTIGIYLAPQVRHIKGSSEADTYSCLHSVQATLYGSVLANLLQEDSNLSITYKPYSRMEYEDCLYGCIWFENTYDILCES